jgi:polyisoprenoid-binding protein YceI
MNAIAVLALLAVPPGETRGETTYWFGANEARTTITFESKTNVTNIVGKTTKVSGSATIDFDAPDKSRCHLIVPAASLNSGMDDRDRAMHGRTWLNSKEFGTIEFKSEKAVKVDARKWKVDGQFTLHGVAQPLSADVDVIQIPDNLGKGLGEGQWVKISTSFPVDITKHGIKIDQSAQFTVEPVWKVSITLFATTAKPADAPAPVAKNDDEDGPRIVRVKAVPAEGLPGKKYVMGKKPQLTTLVATSVTEIENFTIQTSAIAGYVGIDAEKGLGGVRLRVPVAQLKTGIDARDEHLRGPQWLDAAKHPDLYFESTKATKKDDKTWTVEGNFSMHGVTKPLAMDVAVQEVPAEEIKKANWGEKPGLRCTGEFKLKLSDFGVKIPEGAIAKVNDVIPVRLVILALLEE